MEQGICNRGLQRFFENMVLLLTRPGARIVELKMGSIADELVLEATRIASAVEKYAGGPSS